MASGGRKNKINFKARASKSLNCCSLFEPNEIQELKEAFNMIDHDKDGFISEQDLKYMLSSLGNIESTAIITEMMSECTGPLNFTMFLSLFAEKIGSSDPESVILNAFSMFDSTDKGTISTTEFKNWLLTSGERFTKTEVEDLFQSIPLVENGKRIDYREFAKILKNGGDNI